MALHPQVAWAGGGVGWSIIKHAPGAAASLSHRRLAKPLSIVIYQLAIIKRVPFELGQLGHCLLPREGPGRAGASGRLSGVRIGLPDRVAPLSGRWRTTD